MKFLLVILALCQSVCALYSKNDPVIQVTPSTWKKEVESTKTPEYIKTANALKGLAKVVAIDCDAHGSFCARYDVKGFPTIKLFEFDKKKNPVEFQQARNSAALVDFTVAHIDGSLVSQLGTNANRENIDSFLEKKLGKVVLFNKKYGIPPLYKALSIEFENRLLFGEVKSTESELVKRFEITDFPTILLFKEGSLDPIKYDGMFYMTSKRKGVLKYAGLSEFFSKHSPTPPQDSPAASAEDKFDPTVKQIKTQQELETECLSRNILCIIGFASVDPESLDSKKELEQTLKVLENAKLKFQSRATSLNIVWVNVKEAGRKLMRDADVSDFLPGLLAIHAKKSLYRNFRGAFDVDGVQRFISDLLTGQGRNVPLNFKVQLVEDKVKSKDEL